MGRHRLAKPRRRWSVAVAALAALPVAGILTASTGGTPVKAIPGTLECCAKLVAASAQDLGTVPIGAHYIAMTQAELVASRSAVNRTTLHALPAGVGVEQGLQIKTILAERLVSAYFPEIHSIGGVRPDYLKWHPNGQAIDVMIPNYQSPEGKELGDRIAAFALANADRISLNHVIWRRIMYDKGGKPFLMGNLGSDDANHYTHVHIATDGGGYPTGDESYFG
ncbi:hypothetical protein FHT40_003799 [Mycolicibacterium sp. BK556]|uniref:hypothetical protein n=1 Tax=Mycobacteriaceae TaxID=1762 RepID=UPI00105E06FE|nr:MULTISPECIES: hypothetical protein [Mycobacteriaceae]MBB3604138.1 hypothetical protein [Mycolicibacterium sp. BK556]MBB3634334.1 hypothetical protein [Mycolicibacterium sp. BK607]MBB3751914.1 hypothetical protein [Mycolicibacterium sp. BK634]TDO12429.1 hypothetical protein EV580_4156 [Mycobacterium sp. BK086]